MKANKYYHLKMNKFCSFEFKVVDIAKNGDFLGKVAWGHIYKFKNSDVKNCVEITKKEYLNY